MAYSKRYYKLLGVIKGVSVTTGVGADVGFIQLNKGRTYYNPSMHIISKTASGSLALATFAMYTAPSAGGVNLISATAMTSLTTTDLSQIVSATSINIFATDSLWVRQTAVSLNSGTVDIYIYGYES